jgi:hypothetical protein
MTETINIADATTYTLPDIVTKKVIIVGSATATSNIVVQQPLVEFIPGCVITIDYRAYVTYNGGVVIIWGKTLTEQEARRNLTILVSFSESDFQVSVIDVDNAKKQERLKSTTVKTIASSTTINLEQKDGDVIRLQGSGTLAGSCVVNLFNGLLGDEATIIYEGSFSLNGNNITIQGQSLGSFEASAGNIIFKYKHNGVSWDVVSWYLTPEKYIWHTMTVPVSFEAGEQGAILINFDASVYVDYAFMTVAKPLSATDNGAITFDKNTINLATSSIPYSSGFGHTDTVLIEAVFSPSDNFEVITAKSTAGGKVLVLLKYRYI